MSGEPGSALRFGPVVLRVSDPERCLGFYHDLLGLEVLAGADGRIGLRAPSSPADAPLLLLDPSEAWRPRPRGTPGLFHLALLLPARKSLARVLARLHEARYPLHGAADHRVSEALYLTDPEGNGIELYRDRPAEEWVWNGEGEVSMTTLPLNLRALLRDGEEGPDGVPPGTRMGHVHLQGPDLEGAHRLFGEGLGLSVTARSYPGALFFARGRYHHHLAFNRWADAWQERVPDMAGLASYELRFPLPAGEHRDWLAGVARRLGLPDAPERSEIEVHDPTGARLLVRPDSQPA